MQIDELDCSKATRADYRRSLKQFMAWYEDDRFLSENHKIREETRKLYKYISMSYKKDEIDPAEVITDDDKDLLIEKGCINNQERGIYLQSS